MLESNYKVGVLVVTYNREKLLKETIDSIRKQTYSNTEIVVVNNGSTDGSLSWLLNQNDIHTITQENLGGAGGFFTGMKYIAEKGFDYCWLMDDDVECKPTALEELLFSAQIHPQIGFVCSKVIGVNGQAMNVPAVDLSSSSGYPNWFEHIDKQMIKVSASTFVSVLLSKSIIKEVGLPYKEYFIWGDDTEYTMRITRKYSSYVSCRSVVIHKRSIQGALSFKTEVDKARVRNYFYLYRNTLHYSKKHIGKKSYCKICFTMCLSAVVFLAKLDVYKSFIILKSIFNSISFNPKVQFPQ